MERYTDLNISVGTLLKIALVVLGCYLIYFFINLVLVVLTAIVIASAIEPAVSRLARWKIPRVFGVFIVFGAVFAVFALATISIIPPIVEETAQFAEDFPELLENANAWLAENVGASGLYEMFNRQEEVVVNVGFDKGFDGGALTAVFGSLFNIIFIGVLACYFAVQEYGIDNFLKIVVPPKHSKYAVNLWRRSQRKIGLWMQGQLLIMIMTGTVIYLGLLIVGIYYPLVLEFALTLAILAAFAEMIPVVGAFVSAVPAVLVGLLAGGLPAALIIAAFYLVYQQIQGNVIYPMVVNKVVGVPPLLVLIGVIVGGQLFGLLGVILSVPVAAGFMEFIKDIEKQHAQERLRRKLEEDSLADKIAEKVIEKTEKT